jgi:deoxycytidylate deaminase
MIINAGIAEVAYNADYPVADASLALLREAGVKVRQVAMRDPSPGDGNRAPSSSASGSAGRS